MSMQRALKNILGWSEKDIKENFEELRLEKGISAELEKTSQIIKKTRYFRQSRQNLWRATEQSTLTTKEAKVVKVAMPWEVVEEEHQWVVVQLTLARILTV